MLLQKVDRRAVCAVSTACAGTSCALHRSENVYGINLMPGALAAAAAERGVPA